MRQCQRTEKRFFRRPSSACAATLDRVDDVYLELSPRKIGELRQTMKAERVKLSRCSGPAAASGG